MRFDHGLEGKERVERYCFAAAASRHNTAALVVDFVEDEVPPEDEHFEMVMPHDSNNLNSGTETTHDRQTCCLM